MLSVAGAVDKACLNLSKRPLKMETLLTYKECVIIAAGVDSAQNERLIHEVVRLSAADRELLQRARAAATTEEMKRAQESACNIMKR
jgi:hypothetical protein